MADRQLLWDGIGRFFLKKGSGTTQNVSDWTLAPDCAFGAIVQLGNKTLYCYLGTNIGITVPF